MTMFVKLATVTETIMGQAPSSNDCNKDGVGTPFVKAGEFGLSRPFIKEWTTKPLKFAKYDDVLLCVVGATCGKINKGFDGAIGRSVAAVRAKPDFIDKNYLYYFLQTWSLRLRAMSQGAAQTVITRDMIGNLEIPLPPLSEQRRIASILDKADELRQKRQQAIEKLDQLLQATFIDMFGDPVSNPKQWKLGELGDLGVLDRGISKHRPRGAPELLGGIHPLIQTGDVARSQGYIRSYTSTYSDLGLAQSKKWAKGTLCITIAANIANTGILTFDACFPDSVVGFTANQESNAEFVQGLFLFFKQILEEKAPQSAQKNINLAILRALEIPIPPKDLQEKWSKVAQSIEAQKQKLYKQLDIQNQLFSSLQNQAFGGNL
ncbi:restriction endonuclease subunit S [Acinetobacter baumannii]|uniref:restriction endonuclease subunit S n=1 Tax=Acinetobacter baumannii TaxID=470 RepID=UPI00270C3F2C|nr:restriction endonuclease subunit S [Acinetobacter baumannii]MDO7415695.1 restriction endonuclease subunit S [Acinetobacter baumannii]MDR9528970.1 restriction endonuclease subunit S [Acinetobacter baumannii]